MPKLKDAPFSSGSKTFEVTAVEWTYSTLRPRIFRRNGGLAAVRLLSVAILLAFSTGAAAQDSYRFDVINTNNGLPQNTIRAILQTRDGYLWFTTFDGLVRYNGERFEVFNKANSKGINSNRFLSLYEDVDGTLWTGTEDGGLTHYANGRFRTYTLDDGLPSTLVHAIRRTSDGELLVVTTRGPARLQGDRFEPVPAGDYPPGLVTPGPSGDTWYRTGTTLQSKRDGRITSYAVPVDASRFEAAYEDRQGRLWMGFFYYTPGQLWMLKDEVMTRFSTRDGLPPHGFARSICEDREGTMWFGTTNGLVRFKTGRFTTSTPNDGLASNWIVSIM